MATADFTPSRIGQINAAGAVDAIFLKVFAGEVLTAFERANVALKRHMIRTIASGKSAQFPAMGRTTATYHTPGASLDGVSINHAEEVVTIDGLAVAHTFIANIDEAMNHYDVRGPYAMELGRALATLMDTNILRMGLLGGGAIAVATPATVTGLPGGTVQTFDDELTGAAYADAFVASIFSAAQKLDENDAPSEGRFVYVKPADYYAFINSASKIVNRDYTGEGNKGGIESGVVMRIAGIEIVKTNNLPTADDSANTAIPTQYRSDFTRTKALVAQSGAIGTVKLVELGMETEYSVRTQGTLVVAKYACGHKWLRGASLVKIMGDNP